MKGMSDLLTETLGSLQTGLLFAVVVIFLLLAANYESFKLGGVVLITILAVVLGFECGARTGPFLGPIETLAENKALQETVAPRSPWLTIIPWGEIAPYGDEAAFCNYTYTLVALTQ